MADANPMQTRADRVAEALRRLVPAALAEYHAADRASRGALAGLWRAAAKHATDLGLHIRAGDPISDTDLDAHARVVALQARRMYGVKVYGLIFCASHHALGLPSRGEFFLCPDCVEGPEYHDERDPDDVLYRRIDQLEPKGELL